MGTRDTCRLGRHPGKLSRYSGHVAHSQASGKVSLAGLRGALGSFREGCGALEGFRGGLRRTRRLPGLALGFGTWGQVSCSEGDSEGFRRGFRLVSGTRGISSKGSEGGSIRGFEGGIRQGFGMAPKGFSGHSARSEGLRKGVLRGRTSRRGSSKGFPRGCLRKGFREGAAGWLSKGFRKGLRNGRLRFIG